MSDEGRARRFTGTPLFEQLGYNLYRASAASIRDYNRRFEDAGLRSVHLAILCVLDEQPGLTQRELCTRLHVQPANMVPLVVALERKGLIERDVDPADRRAYRLRLTADAERQMPDLAGRLARHERYFDAALSTEEQLLLRDLLHRLWAHERAWEAG